MPTRRHVLQTAAAVALTVARTAARGAAKYDLLVQGGRVIDPASQHDAVADVAIANGRIAAVGRHLLPADAT